MIDWDVVICGGGFAGLTLARQIRFQIPELSILVIEKVERPLPIASHKVGESFGVAPTWWLRKGLKLEEQVDKHVQKIGLHLIGIRGDGPFEDRIEYTARATPFMERPAYQLDRGLFENDVRESNDALGIQMYEGCGVKDIQITEEGPHKVVYEDIRSRTETTISCRFVIDATGRRRFLAKKLGLAREVAQPANATWWRVKGAFDISDLVPKDNTEWHQRVESRRQVTLHLFGKGYWIWFISLPDDYTSIGIVSGQHYHPINERNSYNRSFAWLEKYEPELADWLRETEPLDFFAYKKLAHTTKQAFSDNGWFCVGEAAAFTDPFFGNGADLITWSNTIVTHLIRLKLEDRLTPEITNQYNELYLGWAGTLTEKFSCMYDVLGDDYLMLLKPFWDGAQYFSGPIKLIFLGLLENEKILPDYLALARQFILLNRQVQKLFVQWASARPEKKLPAGFYKPLDGLPRIVALMRASVRERTTEEFLQEMEQSLRLMEDYARVFFAMAVRQVMPEAEKDLPASYRINPYAISLDRGEWQRNGLFSSASEARDLEPLAKEVALVDRRADPARKSLKQRDVVPA